MKNNKAIKIPKALQKKKNNVQKKIYKKLKIILKLEKNNKQKQKSLVIQLEVSIKIYSLYLNKSDR